MKRKSVFSIVIGFVLVAIVSISIVFASSPEAPEYQVLEHYCGYGCTHDHGFVLTSEEMNELFDSSDAVRMIRIRVTTNLGDESVTEYLLINYGDHVAYQEIAKLRNEMTIVQVVGFITEVRDASAVFIPFSGCAFGNHKNVSITSVNTMLDMCRPTPHPAVCLFVTVTTGRCNDCQVFIREEFFFTQLHH